MNDIFLMINAQLYHINSIPVLMNLGISVMIKGSV